MELFSVLHYGFIQRALIAGIFIAILCPVLGLFLVLRRFSLIGDGLAHVAFGSVGIGMLLGVYPLYVVMPLVAVSSLGILELAERTKGFSDAAIGIVSSLGIAAGVIVASLAGGFNVDLFGYLFGSILSTSALEVAISIALSLTVILAIGFFYHDLVSVTFDEEYARVSGVKTRAISRLLVVLTSLTVVLAMKIVGIMLVSSMLILPAVAALQLGKGFKATLLLSVVFSVISLVSGIFVSFAANLPTGATVILFNFLFLIIASVLRRK